MAADAVEIEALSADRLDELEPLWNALREHHAAVGPAWLGPPRERADSWAHRRAKYAGWLAEDPDAFVLVARRGARAIGYAMVRLRAGSATWPAGELAGEVETLCVLPGERGHGVGHLLLAAVHRRLRELDATEVGLHVLHGNDDALRFYEREGFRPFAVWLSAPVPADEP